MCVRAFRRGDVSAEHEHIVGSRVSAVVSGETTFRGQRSDRTCRESEVATSSAEAGHLALFVDQSVVLVSGGFSATNQIAAESPNERRWPDRNAGRRRPACAMRLPRYSHERAVVDGGVGVLDSGNRLISMGRPAPWGTLGEERDGGREATSPSPYRNSVGNYNKNREPAR